MPRPLGTALTDRDRRLFAYFALARHLTAEQVHLLLGDNVAQQQAYRRLARLSAGTAGDSAPFLGRQELLPPKGRAIGFWNLTARGWIEAEKVLPYPVSRPAPTVSQQFLFHQMQVNQVLVELAVQLGGSNIPGIASLPFRWIPEATGQLEFQIRDRQGLYARAAVKPDAIVEVPTGGRRRFFLEAETGSQSITTGQHARLHSGSIKQKLIRYAAYFTALETENLESTWYRHAFHDELFPELLFVVHSKERKERVAWIVSRRLAKLPEPRPFTVRVLCLDEAAGAIAAIAAAKPIARERLVTIREASAVAIRDRVNDLLANFNGVLELVNAHNKSPKAEKIPLPPLPTETLQQLKTLIREELLAKPFNAPKWRKHLIETSEGPP